MPDASMKVYLPWVKREVKGHALQSEFEYTSKPASGGLCSWNSSLKKLSVPLMYAKTRVTPAQVQERNDGLGVAGAGRWGWAGGPSVRQQAASLVAWVSGSFDRQLSQGGAGRPRGIRVERGESTI